jgi:adenylosuccinate lyase
MRVWNENKDFYSELISDKDVRSFLTEEDIKDKFDLGYHTKHVNSIFKRVFGE